MKTPAFWYRPRGFAAQLLRPAAALYHTGSKLRHIRAKPYKAAVPMLCVGNITAGGAGKTPVALALAQRLQEQGAKPAFVTRGYGGHERGPLRVDLSSHKAQDVGDEALLLARQAPVFIARRRVDAVKLAETQATHIILDDGLQNPTLQPDISFLVIDGASGFGNGLTLPAGPLREPLSAALDRVQAVIVIGEGIPPELRKIHQPIIRAYISPDTFKLPKQTSFIAFTGIGRPEKFFASCRTAGLALAACESYADHHFFTPAELKHLRDLAARHQARLLTTEKDFVRLPKDVQAITHVLPITLNFEDTAQIDRLLP